VTTGGDPVAAVTEAEATGEIADLFADIRSTIGVPVVNLVWRHLATMPRALPWVWGTVRPLYRPGRLDIGAEQLRERMDLPATAALPPAVLAAVGLSAIDLAGIERVLASYDHSNTINLLALGAFLRRPGGSSSSPDAGPEAPLRVEQLPKLLTFAEMAPATATLVAQLNLLGERDEGRIVASMWRHLAHWPAFLALSWSVLAPTDSSGALRKAIAGNLRKARPLQEALARDLGRAAAPEPEVKAAALLAVGKFTEHPIGKMVTSCRILRHAMAAGAAR